MGAGEFSVFTFTLTGLLIAGLAGCQGQTKPLDPDTVTSQQDTAQTGDETTGSTSATDTTQSTETTETTEPTEETESTGITGLVLNPDGEPVPDLGLFLIYDYDISVKTGEDGVFTADLPSGGTFAVHVLGNYDGWADIMTMVPVSEGEFVTLETPFTLVEVGSTTDMTDQPAAEVALTDDLWLSLDPAVITPGFGVDGLYVGAVEATGFPPSLPTGEVLAVWYFTPFGARSDEPMSVRITNRWSLAPGATLMLYQPSYIDHAWIEAGEVTVSDDGTELVGGNFTQFSTLVLAAPDGSSSE